MSTADGGAARAFVPSRDVAPETMAIVRERSAGEVVDLAQLLREALPTAIDASEDGKGGTRSMLGRAVVLLLATCDEQRQSFDRSIAARQEVDRLQQGEIAELQTRVAELEATIARASDAAIEDVEKARRFGYHERASEHACATDDPRVWRSGIYIASKTKHAPRWLSLRFAGTPIVSTWIDEAGEGETSDWADLWDRCIHEATTCSAMVVYVEAGEVHKGSLVEVGAALHAGVPVFWVGPEYSTAPRHRNVRRCADVAEAIACARRVIRGEESR